MIFSKCQKCQVHHCAYLDAETKNPSKAFFCFNLFHVFRYYFTRGSTASGCRPDCLVFRTAPIWKLIRFCMAQGAPPLDVNLAMCIAPERRCEQETLSFPQCPMVYIWKSVIANGMLGFGKHRTTTGLPLKTVFSRFVFAYLRWLSLYLVLKQSFATNPTVSLAINLFSINFLPFGPKLLRCRPPEGGASFGEFTQHLGLRRHESTNRSNVWEDQKQRSEI